MLNTLEPTKFMFLQLANCFSVQDSPIWMDSSTGSYCESMEKKLGGPQVTFIRHLIKNITLLTSSVLFMIGVVETG